MLLVVARVGNALVPLKYTRPWHLGVLHVAFCDILQLLPTFCYRILAFQLVSSYAQLMLSIKRTYIILLFISHLYILNQYTYVKWLCHVIANSLKDDTYAKQKTLKVLPHLYCRKQTQVHNKFCYWICSTTL
jgi:hypothetical protein